MPTNWGPFLAGTEPRVAEKFTSGKNRLTDSNALVDTKMEYPNATRTLVAQIVQKAFPQYVNRNNAKVTADLSENGALASYGGLKGNQISAGKISGNIETYTYKDQPVTGAFGATTDDVMDGVGIMLHELMHARQHSNPNSTPNSSKLGKDWQSLLKDAAELDFPSVKKNLFGGDALEELIATAVPVTEMRQRGMTPTGRLKDIPAALDKLNAKYPWLPDYIKEQSDPESMKPKPSTLDTAVTYLQNLLK
jgi:hypothetical protein